MRNLISIELFRFTGQELGNFRNKFKRESYFYDRLPEYTINVNTGGIERSEYYLAWIESGNEYYWLFNIKHQDTPLNFETEGIGLEDFVKPGFESYDKIFKEMSYITYNDYGKSYPNTQHLVYDINYIKSYRGLEDMYDEYDVEINLVGYLNNDCELIKI